jgi:hypothetical protein
MASGILDIGRPLAQYQNDGDIQALLGAAAFYKTYIFIIIFLMIKIDFYEYN